MKLRTGFAFVLAVGLAAIPAMASRVHRAPTSGKSHSSSKRHVAAKATPKRLHGQQVMEPERVTAIQSALVREHYLSAEPSGKWDSDTQAAMLKFQADQGWQTKLTPDSRALIKLGLGPNHSGALNAGANFNTLNTPTNLPSSTVAGFTAGSGVSH